MGVDTDAAAGVGAQVASRPKSSDVMALFAVMWAAATLFHVWGSSGDITDLASNWSTLGALQAAAAVAALGVLARPRALAPLVVMASLAPFIAWFEAPVLGSHWVVVTIVDAALLLSVIAAVLITLVIRARGRLVSMVVRVICNVVSYVRGFLF